MYKLKIKANLHKHQKVSRNGSKLNGGNVWICILLEDGSTLVSTCEKLLVSVWSWSFVSVVKYGGLHCMVALFTACPHPTLHHIGPAKSNTCLYLFNSQSLHMPLKYYLSTSVIAMQIVQATTLQYTNIYIYIPCLYMAMIVYFSSILRLLLVTSLPLATIVSKRIKHFHIGVGTSASTVDGSHVISPQRYCHLNPG